jgi:HK97 family phage prohead protease/HK97 family phage major capsid protein
MKPHKDESQSDFMKRCVPEMMGDGKREQDQAVAACMDIWRNKDNGGGTTKQFEDAAPEPEDDESYEDFLDRCTDELLDNNPDADDADLEAACDLRWQERRARGIKRKDARGLVHKVHAEPVGEQMLFVLSDETPDRMGDIIQSDGWDLTAFQKNPIALWNHVASFPIGTWKDVHAEGGLLRGRLKLAPPGTSDRIDEIRKLIEAGILKAVSVGFRPIDAEPLDKKNPFSGMRFIKQELVETSVVAVPANPNALAIAKSLKISADTQALVFAGHGSRSEIKRRGVTTGEHAVSPRSERKAGAMSLSQRITDSQGRINALRDALTEHLKSVDDSNVSDAQLEATQEFNAKIAQEEKGLAALKEAETRLASTTAMTQQTQEQAQTQEIRLPTRVERSGPIARPFTIPQRKLSPEEYVWRSITVLVKHHKERGQRSLMDVMRSTYGDDEGTGAVLGWMTRTATNPATTTTTGWAAELVAVVMGEFLNALMPVSVFPQVAAKGMSFTFGRNGIITLPLRNTTPTIAGSFVGEGAPIPVRQGGFSTSQLTPKKMGVISTFTREISEHSTPSIEQIVRQAILDDTGVAIDSVLLDNNAATAIRPAGLLNGVTPQTPTAGGGFNAVIGDTKLLTNALITATRGNLRSPVWIMSPALALSLSLTPTTGAQALPFKEEVGRGTFMGIPIIQSTNVTATTLILMDAADFASASGEDPRFEVSDQAVLHMEDTTPLAIGSAGTPNVVAAPTRSLWQTDTIGIRMILPLNWVMRRTGSVQVVNTVSWA